METKHNPLVVQDQAVLPNTASGWNIVFAGLSVTSSWGNGHATTYRALIKALNAAGHSVLFLERDLPWYAGNRDLPSPPFCHTVLYADLDQLRREHEHSIADADLVVIGSYVPEGVRVGEWVLETARGTVAFYDIDTPVTLAKLEREDHEYISPDLIERYPLYLSFTGGPTLRLLEEQFGSPAARPLYCSVDPDLYYPEKQPLRYDMAYMGTYSDDRQPPLQRLMLQAAEAWPRGRFLVAGPQYPQNINWPPNVDRVDHLPPAEHRSFYNSQRFTLNVTRQDMIQAGYAPSVRLFEAAACGTPIISDCWPGLETIFEPDREILLSSSSRDTLSYLREMPETERQAIGARARKRVLAEHTASARAKQLLAYVEETQRATAPISPP